MSSWEEEKEIRSDSEGISLRVMRKLHNLAVMMVIQS